MSSSKKELTKVSQQLLDRLLEFRKEHRGFTFSLRKRDSNRSKEKRLEKGQWFHGSNYIFIGLFRKMDTARKVSTLGFVVDFEKDGTIKDTHLTVSIKGGVTSPGEIKFHKELAQELKIDLKNNRGSWEYPDSNYLNNIEDYLKRVYPLATKLLEKYELQKMYTFKEEEFLKRLERIESIHQKLIV